MNTIPGDYSIINYLIDSCDSLIHALRDLQAARLPADLPAQITVAPNPVVAVDGAITPAGATPPTASDVPTGRELRRAEAEQHIDAMVQLAIDEPQEWHPWVLADQERTPKGYRRLFQRLKYRAKRRGVKLTMMRYMDEDDDGFCINVRLAGGGR